MKQMFPPEVDVQVEAAEAAEKLFGALSNVRRADLLMALSSRLQANAERLLSLAELETNLPNARLRGELSRTCFQLEAFASIVASGQLSHRLDDPAVEGLPPRGHPHLVLKKVPIGPVAMFSASNFPFAFSVLGGDTVAALAAGCPVVIKAHPGHLGLSAAVWGIAKEVLREMSLPEGVIGMVSDVSHEVGASLVRHPSIAAVAFTGSLAGGTALQAVAQQRTKPIPFYGELGSVNPVIVLPPALTKDLVICAEQLAASVTQNAGQFCTSPGLVVLLDSPLVPLFVAEFARVVQQASLHAMLTPGIRAAFEAGVQAWKNESCVKQVTTNLGSTAEPVGFVGQVSADAFLESSALQHEVFGSACLVVVAKDFQQVHEVLLAVGGSLTVTILGAEEGTAEHHSLLQTAESVAGRVLFSGVPTGVAVTAAQHHGGPWPASTQPLFTSVGWHAVDRFLRPVVLQSPPKWAL